MIGVELVCGMGEYMCSYIVVPILYVIMCGCVGLESGYGLPCNGADNVNMAKSRSRNAKQSRDESIL